MGVFPHRGKGGGEALCNREASGEVSQATPGGWPVPAPVVRRPAPTVRFGLRRLYISPTVHLIVTRRFHCRRRAAARTADARRLRGRIIRKD